MTNDPPAIQAHRFSGGRFIELLTGFTLLMVIQTGLVPFDFAGPGDRHGAGVFFEGSPSPWGTADVVGNVFLYLPVGALLYWTVTRAGRSRLQAVLGSLVLSAGLSSAVEWLQSFSPVRVSSFVDLAANVIGAGLGIGLARVTAWFGPRLFDAAAVELRERPLATAIKAYVLVLVIFAMMPFSFTLDAGLLKRSVKEINLRPFGSLERHWSLADTAFTAGDQPGYAAAREQAQRCWSRWAAELASFAVLAWLLLTLLHEHYGFGPATALGLVGWSCGGLALALSVGQLVVLTRTVDITDVVFRVAGILVGSLTKVLCSAGAGRPAPHDRPDRVRHAATAGSAAALLYILATGLMPFLLEAPAASPGGGLKGGWFVPFYAGFPTRFDLMLGDVMEKFAAYLVFAVLLVTARPSLTRRGLGGCLRTIIATGFGVAAVIEVAQIFLPDRVVDVTDLALAGCGCAAGVLVQHHVVRFYAFARGLPPVAAERWQADSAAPWLAPADALIGELMVPHPGAPAEHAPRTRAQHRP